MSTTEIIDLSDDEPAPPIAKKIKLDKPKIIALEVIELSDDDDSSTDLIQEKKTEPKTALVTQNEDPQGSSKTNNVQAEKENDVNNQNLIDKNDLPTTVKAENCEDEKEEAASSGETSNDADEDIDLAPNTSSAPSASYLKLLERLNEFLRICEEKTSGTKFDLTSKSEVLRKLFRKLEKDFEEEKTLESTLEKCITQASEKSDKAVFAFKEIYNLLKTLNGPYIEMDSAQEVLKLKKLEKTIRALKRKIVELENAEVNWSDEEDSTFIQLDRYSARLDKVHKKYCSLLKKNPYSGRIIYERLSFVQSEHNEINLCINKKYKNSLKFPSYLEVEKCIRECVKENDLPFSENKILSESKHVFTKLGELLQLKRRRDLLQCHLEMLGNSDDPAKSNTELDDKLKSNAKIAKGNLDKVHELYVKKQEEGKATEEAPDESEDSDNSNYQDSEGDE